MAALILDVRKPEEIAEGALEGALFVDFMGEDFAGQVSELDKSADYIVYCRSGNRSGQSIAIMAELGFSGVLTNGGGLEDAAALTGLAIVK